MATSGFEGLIRYSRMARMQSCSWRSLSPAFAHFCFRAWVVVIPIHWRNSCLGLPPKPPWRVVKPMHLQPSRCVWVVIISPVLAQMGRQTHNSFIWQPGFRCQLAGSDISAIQDELSATRRLSSDPIPQRSHGRTVALPDIGFSPKIHMYGFRVNRDLALCRIRASGARCCLSESRLYSSSPVLGE